MRDDDHTSLRLGVVWNQIEEQFALSDYDAHAVAQVVRQVAVRGLGHVLGSWVGTQGKTSFSSSPGDTIRARAEALELTKQFLREHECCQMVGVASHWNEMTEENYAPGASAVRQSRGTTFRHVRISGVDVSDGAVAR
jgi:hypothetical protein